METKWRFCKRFFFFYTCSVVPFFGTVVPFLEVQGTSAKTTLLETTLLRTLEISYDGISKCVCMVVGTCLATGDRISSDNCNGIWKRVLRSCGLLDMGSEQGATVCETPFWNHVLACLGLNRCCPCLICCGWLLFREDPSKWEELNRAGCAEDSKGKIW